MKKLWWLIGVLAGLIWWLSLEIIRLPDGMLHFWVLDVGQGDAILAESPLGQWILIDGGPDAAIVQKMGKIMPLYADKIDLMILSHPHADHLNGLLDVLERYQVTAVLMTGVNYQYGAYDEFYRLLSEKGVSIRFTDGSSDFKLGKIGFDLIYPDKSIQGEVFNNLNNSSMIFRMIYGQRKFFFSGDLEEVMEKNLVDLTENSGLKLEADFLKAGHHGSKTSNSDEWIEKINPLLAVISCGIDNSFKHPAATTVERFLKKQIRLWRTDIDGTIEIRTDGKDLLESRSSKNERWEKIYLATAL